MKLTRAYFASPLGRIVVLAADDEQLVGLEFESVGPRVSGLLRHLERHLGTFQIVDAPDPAGAVTRLAHYFDGDRLALESQPVRMIGTPFQQRVWSELRRIRPGDTLSYGALAERVGKPNAQRAVGAANGANPVSLFVPCHRVISSDGSLHGYGGGLDRKAWLLAHEGARPLLEHESRALATAASGA